MVIGGGLIRRPRLEKRTPAAFLSFLLFFLLCILSRVRLVDNIFCVVQSDDVFVGCSPK